MIVDRVRTNPPLYLCVVALKSRSGKPQAAGRAAKSPVAPKGFRMADLRVQHAVFTGQEALAFVPCHSLCPCCSERSVARSWMQNGHRGPVPRHFLLTTPLLWVVEGGNPWPSGIDRIVLGLIVHCSMINRYFRPHASLLVVPRVYNPDPFKKLEK